MQELRGESLKSQKNLDEISKIHGFDSFLSRKVAEHFAVRANEFATGQLRLELGPAEGWGTKILSGGDWSLDAVDGSKNVCDKLKEEFPKVKVFHALFEDFSPSSRYDTIFASHVLEHVDEPLGLLFKMKRWLKSPLSRVIISTPNSESLHRQIGVRKSFLKSTKELHLGDLQVGHKRVFDLPELTQMVEDAGFTLVERSGFFLKPLSASQLSALADDDLDALFEGGRFFPELAADTFIVAERGED